jgi:hypothetical protein
MKLFRTIVLLAGLAFILPSPPADLSQPPEASPSNFALMSAASDAFRDVNSFCLRQPSVCQTADYVADKAQAKAKYSFKLAYEWANGTKSPAFRETLGADDLATSSTVPPLRPTLN